MPITYTKVLSTRGFILLDSIIGLTLMIVLVVLIAHQSHAMLRHRIYWEDKRVLIDIHDLGRTYTDDVIDHRQDNSDDNVLIPPVFELSTTSDRVSYGASVELFAPHINKIHALATTTHTYEERSYTAIGSIDDNFALCTLHQIPRELREKHTIYFDGLVTDIRARTGRVYVTLNSTVRGDPDLVVIDTQTGSTLYSTTTGPGYESLVLDLPHIYLANTGADASIHVMQEIRQDGDIDMIRLSPWVGRGTSSPPWPQTLGIYGDSLYVGFEKHVGAEVVKLDITTEPPTALAEAETNTLVNTVSQSGDLVYVAASDEQQLRVYDTDLTPLTSYSPSGHAVQQGRSAMALDRVVWGRTVGGFNNPNNHELFVQSLFGDSPTLQNSIDVPTGVYDLLVFGHDVLIATASTSGIQRYQMVGEQIRFVQGLRTGPAHIIACNESYVVGYDNYIAIYEPIY